jgi:hypothetical protein
MRDPQDDKLDEAVTSPIEGERTTPSRDSPARCEHAPLLSVLLNKYESLPRVLPHFLPATA